MPEKDFYPSFHQPNEAGKTLNAEELVTSGRIFSDFFDEVMLRYIDEVKIYESNPDKPTANLFMRIIVDGQEYSFSLEDRGACTHEKSDSRVTFTDSERFTRLIDLQKIEGCYKREFWSYRLGADGIVRRWDGGDKWAKSQRERKFGITKDFDDIDDDSTPEEILEYLNARSQDLIENVIPNTRLEENMGLNNQPVPPEELDGLKSFISRASVKTTS